MNVKVKKTHAHRHQSTARCSRRKKRRPQEGAYSGEVGHRFRLKRGSVGAKRRWLRSSSQGAPHQSRFPPFVQRFRNRVGKTCSKCRGSLEMPVLRAEEEIRDERFWPERGKKQGIEHTTAPADARQEFGDAERLEMRRGGSR